MTKQGRDILNALLAIDIGIILFCMLWGNRHCLYSTQIGFWSAALVISASMISYRNMIHSRLANLTEIDSVRRDPLDAIDDRFELYDDDEPKETREYTKEEFLDEVTKQKQIQKASRRTPYQVIKDSRAFLSIYRLGAYGFLILGFLYLNRHGFLHLPSYLFSLAVPPAVMVIILMRSRDS